MRRQLVLTASGRDRVGIVEEITALILRFEGNIESSRMVRLGGDFAMLMFVSAPEERIEGLRAAGLGKGDAIGLYMPMVPEIVIALLAIAKIGGVILPLFSGFGPSAIATRLAHARAKAHFTADEIVVDLMKAACGIDWNPPFVTARAP